MSITDDLNSKLIYSTAGGSICSGCSQPLKSCCCRTIKQTALAPIAKAVRLRYELNGRKGKGVTLITGLALNEIKLLDLAKKLKLRFGTGGTVKDYTIQLQGDFCQLASEYLRKLGYPVK